MARIKVRQPIQEVYVDGKYEAILSDIVVTYMTCVGSLLIFALGLNMLNISNIKVANLLPSMFIPIILGIFNII